MSDLDGPDVPEPAGSAPAVAPGLGHQVEVEVDLGAFLPETSAIGPVEDGDEAAEPVDAEAAEDRQEPVDAEVVEDLEESVEVEAVEDLDAEAGIAAPDGVPAAPPVDLAVLAGIEADLAAVDRAIEAIDAGDHERSPLLVELLDAPPT